MVTNAVPSFLYWSLITNYFEAEDFTLAAFDRLAREHRENKKGPPIVAATFPNTSDLPHI